MTEFVDLCVDDKNIWKREDLICNLSFPTQVLFNYIENESVYRLHPTTYYIEGQYLYLSQCHGDKYSRYDLEEARRKGMRRIPLRMANGNTVFARADLLTSDYQLIGREHINQQDLMRQRRQQQQRQQQHGCKTAIITTTVAIMSTILIALVLHH